MRIIAFTHNTRELKEKIRAVIKDHLETNEDIHVSLVYYEVRTYKKPPKGKKKKK